MRPIKGRGASSYLGSYDQDAINDSPDRFANPAFYCNVQNVTREADGLEYPVMSGMSGAPTARSKPFQKPRLNCMA